MISPFPFFFLACPIRSLLACQFHLNSPERERQRESVLRLCSDFGSAPASCRASAVGNWWHTPANLIHIIKHTHTHVSRGRDAERRLRPWKPPPIRLSVCLSVLQPRCCTISALHLVLMSVFCASDQQQMFLCRAKLWKLLGLYVTQCLLTGTRLGRLIWQLYYL